MGNVTLSYITKAKTFQDGHFVLEKDYSKKFRLKDGSSIEVASTVGLIRENQQDSLAISINDNFKLLLLADGMGGMKEGEKASYYTVKIIKDLFEYENGEYLNNITKEKLQEVLFNIVYEIKHYLGDQSGTTLVFALICKDKTYVVSIGDSRIYTIEDGVINLITYDDSVSFEQFRPFTSYERDRLRFYVHNNRITNSIDKYTIPRINVSELDNYRYDTICLMSDGISDLLQENTIRECLVNKNSASNLIKLTKSGPIPYNEYPSSTFYDYLNLGKDNASTIVYKKKRK